MNYLYTGWPKNKKKKKKNNEKKKTQKKKTTKKQTHPSTPFYLRSGWESNNQSSLALSTSLSKGYGHLTIFTILWLYTDHVGHIKQ